MPSLLVTLNEQPIIHAGNDSCTSLSWDVYCCRHEENVGSLYVQGMIARPDGNYDHLYWLENYVLQVGDTLGFACSAADGASPIARLHTHEQLEELRVQVAGAEANGEYEAARKAHRPTLRATTTLELLANGTPAVRATAAGDITTAICSGRWSTDIRPEEWRLRLCAIPASKPTSGFWTLIAGGATVVVRA